MSREFYEETGLYIGNILWYEFCEMNGSSFRVNVFTHQVNDEQFNKITTETDEEIIKVDVNRLPDNVLFNLKWLIPIALDSYRDNNFKWSSSRIC